jgi:hypothetical protein
MSQLHHVQGLRDALADLAAAHLLHPEPEPDVFLHRHVGEERIRLEHRVHRPLVRRLQRHFHAADSKRALGGELEPGDHAQGRRLAAAARPEQREELAVSDAEVEISHRVDVAKDLRHSLEDHGVAHGSVPFPASRAWR